MLFKSPAMEAQWKAAHPELRVAMADLVDQLALWDFPPLCVTEVNRTKAENFAIYFARELALGTPEPQAKALAEHKRSFHFCACAADFRSATTPWTEEQWDKVFDFLRHRCPKEQWELLFHDTGSGKHLHLAAKDWPMLREWERAQKGVA